MIDPADSRPARVRRILASVILVGILLVPAVSLAAPAAVTATPHRGLLAPSSTSDRSPTSATAPPALRPNPLPASERLPSSLFPTAFPIPSGHRLLGAPQPISHAVRSTDSWGNGSDYSFPGSNLNWSLLNASCYGVWPGAQSGYLNNCYGHDEPGVEAYSTLPGSGGNVTWNVQLPTENGPTQNQSNLYAAIWFGLVLTDPFGWMDQCYLELQFYPDSSFTSSTSVYGEWAAAAVGWQIEALTGYEDACFYQPLTFDSNPGTYFAMTQGDNVTVKMTGWQHDPNGETLSIDDTTAGQTSTVQMYNYYQGYPLDPAYSTNNYENALQWTTGGELPVAFAFETGHTVAPYPNTNNYGGCSAGAPPPTSADPAVPCPSYDPGFWLNDTAAPWHIAPPVYFNGSTTQVSPQVTFAQDLGGISFIDPISGGTCDGRDGSAFCTYPWYSYSCSAGAFEFGATDYPGMTTDFGEYDQYSVTPIYNEIGVGYYPPKNFSMPSCGAPTYSLGITPSGGSVHFLHEEVATTTTVPGLLPGNYSVTALAPAGEVFVQWNTTGAVVVDDPTDPWGSVEVDGNGTLTADLAATAPTVAVTFDDAGAHGRIQLTDGFTWNPNAANYTLTNGAVLDLLPGVYSINALPNEFYNFSHWAVNNSGGTLGAYTFPFTWLTVTGGESKLTVTASYAKSTSTAQIYVYPYGEFGSVYVNGTLVSYGGEVSLPVGTYTVSAVASAGSAVNYLSVAGSAVSLSILDYAGLTVSGNVTFENGTSVVYGYFTHTVSVTLDDQPANGSISFGGDAPAANGTVVLTPEYYPTYYSLIAIAPPGEAFAGWSVSSRGAAEIGSSASQGTYVLLNSSVTLTATYVLPTDSASHVLDVVVSPTGAGTVGVAGYAYAGSGGVINGLPNGTYLLNETTNPGFTFAGWTPTGSASLENGSDINYPFGDLLVVDGASGTLTATFVANASRLYAVSFYSSPAGGSAIIDTTAVPAGASILLSAGDHTLTASVFSATVSGWATTGDLSTSGGSGNATTLVVNGSGAVYVLSGEFGFLDASVSPTNGLAPLTIHYDVTALGGFLAGPVSWAFDDGTGNATIASGTHTFAMPRNYTVTVVVSFPPIGTLLGQFLVDVRAAPLTAGIVTNTSGGVAPLAVAFSALATGGSLPLSYAWTFGDGAAASGANVSHTYLTSGAFNATVNVSDTSGQKVSRTVTIFVLPGLTVALVATPMSGVAPLYVAFATVVQGGSGPYVFSWVFGDGAGGPLGPSPFHTYGTAGTYTATVTVTDVEGGRASATQSITVRAAALSGSLAASPASVMLGGSTTLTASVSGGTSPYTYAWTTLPAGCVGANVSTLTCAPTQAGTTEVQLSVTDAAGQVLHLTTNVTVTTQPTGTSPAGGATPTLEYAAIIAVVAIVLVALAVLYAVRRRNVGPGSPPES